MDEFLARLRAWLASSAAPDPERKAIENRLREQDGKLRLARLDAGLPVDRRRYFELDHPGRRADDR